MSKPFQSGFISQTSSPRHVLIPLPVLPDNGTLSSPPVVLPAAVCMPWWADRGWQSSLRHWGSVQRSYRWPTGTKWANKESKKKWLIWFKPAGKTHGAVTWIYRDECATPDSCFDLHIVVALDLDVLQDAFYVVALCSFAVLLVKKKNIFYNHFHHIRCRH